MLNTEHEPLASEGGQPVRTGSVSPWPHFSEEEIEATAAVLRTGKVNYWTGQQGREFEREYAAYAGMKHAIVLTNGTVALELALYALGIGSGDEVVTTARTFIASASCAVMRGAKPVLVDVDQDSGNITAATVLPSLTKRTKAIIAVHLGGWPCEMDGILELARERKIAVIEDCAQAHGAEYRGRTVGSFGDFNAFSFCQDKIITTGGEGGMVMTNDTAAWERAWAYKDHGKSYRAVYEQQHPPGFRWVHDSFGTNWRATEIQSVIGRIQLRRLQQNVEARRKNAAILDRCFSQLPALRTVTPPAHVKHSYYKYYVYLRPEMLRPGWTRERLITSINEEGVPCFSGTCSEIYLEKAFAPELRPPRGLRNAKRLGETTLMFLVHPTLTPADIQDTCRAVEKVFTAASK